MTILRAGFGSPHLAVVAVFLAALVVLFCGFFYQVGRLTLGPQQQPAGSSVLPERLDAAMGATLVAAALAVVSAFYLPGTLVALVHAAVRVVEGS